MATIEEYLMSLLGPPAGSGTAGAAGMSSLMSLLAPATPYGASNAAYSALPGANYGLYGSPVTPPYGGVDFRSNTDYRSPYSYGLAGLGPAWFYGQGQSAPAPTPGALPRPKKPKAKKPKKKSPAQIYSEEYSDRQAIAMGSVPQYTNPGFENLVRESDEPPVAPVNKGPGRLKLADDTMYDLPQWASTRSGSTGLVLPQGPAHMAWEKARGDINSALMLDKADAPDWDTFISENYGKVDGLLKAIEYYGLSDGGSLVDDKWSNPEEHYRQTAGGFNPGEETNLTSIGELMSIMGLDANYQPWYFNNTTGEVTVDPTQKKFGRTKIDINDPALKAFLDPANMRKLEVSNKDTESELAKLLGYKGDVTSANPTAQDTYLSTQFAKDIQEIKSLARKVTEGGWEAVAPKSVGFAKGRALDPSLLAGVTSAGTQKQLEDAFIAKTKDGTLTKADLDQWLPYFGQALDDDATIYNSGVIASGTRPDGTKFGLTEDQLRGRDNDYTARTFTGDTSIYDPNSATGFNQWRPMFGNSIFDSAENFGATGLDMNLFAQPWFQAWMQSTTQGPGIERYVNLQNGADIPGMTTIEHPIIGRVSPTMASQFDQWLNSSAGAYIAADSRTNPGGTPASSRELFNEGNAWQYYMDATRPYGTEGARSTPFTATTGAIDWANYTPGNSFYDRTWQPTQVTTPSQTMTATVPNGYWTGAPEDNPFGQMSYSVPGETFTQWPEAFGPVARDVSAVGTAPYKSTILGRLGFADGGMVNGDDDMNNPFAPMMNQQRPQMQWGQPNQQAQMQPQGGTLTGGPGAPTDMYVPGSPDPNAIDPAQLMQIMQTLGMPQGGPQGGAPQGGGMQFGGGMFQRPQGQGVTPSGPLGRSPGNARPPMAAQNRGALPSLQRMNMQRRGALPGRMG